jgi:hypothetical protein
MNKKVTEIHLYINSKSSTRTVPWYSQKCWSAGCNTMTNHPIAESSDYNPDDSMSNLRKLLDAYTKKYHIDLEIHDLDLKSEQRKNLFNRIDRTPLLIIGGRKIYTMPTSEKELSELCQTT